MSKQQQQKGVGVGGKSGIDDKGIGMKAEKCVCVFSVVVVVVG